MYSTAEFPALWDLLAHSCRQILDLPIIRPSQLATEARNCPGGGADHSGLAGGAVGWAKGRGWVGIWIILDPHPMTLACQDQVQKFNARAEEFHRTHGDDEDAPFQACLLGSAQKDEKIIDQAVRGQCCCSAQKMATASWWMLVASNAMSCHTLCVIVGIVCLCICGHLANDH